MERYIDYNLVYMVSLVKGFCKIHKLSPRFDKFTCLKKLCDKKLVLVFFGGSKVNHGPLLLCPYTRNWCSGRS